MSKVWIAAAAMTALLGGCDMFMGTPAADKTDVVVDVKPADPTPAVDPSEAGEGEDTDADVMEVPAGTEEATEKAAETPAAAPPAAPVKVQVTSGNRSTTTEAGKTTTTTTTTTTGGNRTSTGGTPTTTTTTTAETPKTGGTRSSTGNRSGTK